LEPKKNLRIAAKLGITKVKSVAVVEKPQTLKESFRKTKLQTNHPMINRNSTVDGAMALCVN